MLMRLCAVGSLLSFRLRNRYERRAAWTPCGDRTCTAVASPGVVAIGNGITRLLARPDPMQGGSVAW